MQNHFVIKIGMLATGLQFQGQIQIPMNYIFFPPNGSLTRSIN